MNKILKRLKLKFLQTKAWKIYNELESLPFGDGGVTMTNYMFGTSMVEVNEKKREFNKVMDELKILDPTAPNFRYDVEDEQEG